MFLAIFVSSIISLSHSVSETSVVLENLVRGPKGPVTCKDEKVSPANGTKNCKTVCKDDKSGDIQCSVEFTDPTDGPCETTTDYDAECDQCQEDGQTTWHRCCFKPGTADAPETYCVEDTIVP